MSLEPWTDPEDDPPAWVEQLIPATDFVDLDPNADDPDGFNIEIRGYAADLLTARAAVLGVTPKDLLVRLLRDILFGIFRRRYVRGVVAEQQLWRDLRSRTADYADLDELRDIIDELEEVRAENRRNRTGLPSRDPVAAQVIGAPMVHGIEYWPRLPKPPDTTRGGRPRLEDEADPTWVRLVVEADRLNREQGLTWRQCAGRLHVTETELLNWRRRAGLA